MKRKIITPAYLRWKEQLEAMKRGELGKVRKLAQDAREALLFKRSGKIQLSF